MIDTWINVFFGLYLLVAAWFWLFLVRLLHRNLIKTGTYEAAAEEVPTAALFILGLGFELVLLFIASLLWPLEFVKGGSAFTTKIFWGKWRQGKE